VSEPNEKPKWGKGKVALFIAVMVFLFVVVPFVIIAYWVWKFSRI